MFVRGCLCAQLPPGWTAVRRGGRVSERTFMEYIGPAGITVTSKAKAWQAYAAMPPPPPPGSRTKRARRSLSQFGSEMAIGHELTTDELDLGADDLMAAQEAEEAEAEAWAAEELAAAAEAEAAAAAAEAAAACMA